MAWAKRLKEDEGIFHLTHRCHSRVFLMEVACERLIIGIRPRAFLLPAHDRNGADRRQRVGLVCKSARIPYG